jgi:hypothetical protein
MPHRPAALAALLAAWLVPVVTSAREAEPRRTLRRIPLAGVIELHGCSVRPADVELTARSLPATDSETGQSFLAAPETHRAIVRHAGNRLSFQFRALAKGLPYEIEPPVLAGDTDCTKVLWRTDTRGIVIAERRRRVHIEGFAIRSRIEVLSVRQGRETDQWVGADALDFDDASAAIRRFRWTPNVRGAVAGRLQVSMRPFPTPGRGYDPCATPPLVYARDFPAERTGATEIAEVDFSRILRDTRAVAANDSEPTLPLTPAERVKLEAGAPLYVRVAPLAASGRLLCTADRAGVTPMTILAKIPLDKFVVPGSEPSLALAGARYDPPIVHSWPSGGQVCYRTTKPHLISPCDTDYMNQNPFCSTPVDAWGGWLHSFGVPYGWVSPGLPFCFYTSSGGSGWFGDFIESIGSVVTGFVDTVAALVNQASYLWEKLQDLAVEAVAQTINSLGIPCDATCRQGLELGLEVGLASMGIPPSLPNFDQLVDQGIDYAAAMAAEQAGVPYPLNDLATGKAKELVKKAAAAMKANDSVPGLPDWVGYDIGLEPAVLTLRVFGNQPELPVTPFLFLAPSDVYLGASLALPRKMPPAASPLTIPLTLPINVEGLPAAPANASDYQKARHNKIVWAQQRLDGGCAGVFMSAIAYQDWRVFMEAAVVATDPTFYLTETGPFYCQP